MADMAKKHIKTNAIRILETEKISFEIKTYDSDGFTDGVAVAEKLGQDFSEVFKTLVTENKSHENFVFVIPVCDELDLKKCASSVGEKSLAMIHVKDINRITGYIRGGCSPLGMKKQFKTVIDTKATTKEKIFISGGKIGIQIGLSPKDLAHLISADFSDIIKK